MLPFFLFATAAFCLMGSTTKVVAGLHMISFYKALEDTIAKYLYNNEEYMSLVEREARFSEICSRFQSQRPGELIASYQLPKDQFSAIHTAAMLFISKCLPTNEIILDEERIMQQVDALIEDIPNITPNGKFMPKPHMSLEYNIFVRTVGTILKGLNIAGLLSQISVPILRYKSAHPTGKDRPFSTEKPHLEAWYGHSKDTITIQVPLLGDIEGNCLKLSSPPQNFDEEWAEPLDDFDQGRQIASKYIANGVPYKAGNLYLFEATTLHETVRKPNAGSRISMDIMMVCKTELESYKSISKATRTLDLRLKPESFFELTDSMFLLPKDSMSGMIEKERLISLRA